MKAKEQPQPSSDNIDASKLLGLKQEPCDPCYKVIMDIRNGILKKYLKSHWSSGNGGKLTSERSLVQNPGTKWIIFILFC